MDRDGMPGRRLQPFFVAVCVQAREHAKASPERVADLAGLGAKSIIRFERGETFPHENLERYAAAYATATNMLDGRVLILRAVRWWIDHGSRPLTVHEEEAQPWETVDFPALIESIRRAGELDQARVEAELPPSATETRAANGG